ncbi:MAG: hypothetical protein ACP5T5_01575 [Thermoprotei archaeon]|nr:hypothetical protein [TACK group archaeon]
MSFEDRVKKNDLVSLLEPLKERLAEMSDEEKFKTVISLFGRRGKKAVQAIKDNTKILKVKSKPIYLVRGKRLDYITIGLGYCSCEDFYLNNVLRGLGVPCYHQLVLILAQSMGKNIEEINVQEFQLHLSKSLS